MHALSLIKSAFKFRQILSRYKYKTSDLVNKRLLQTFNDDFFKKEMIELNKYYPLIVNDLVAVTSQYKDFDGFQDRFPVLLNYTVPQNHSYFMTVAVTTLYSYKALEKPEFLTEENIKKACIMSWVYRLLEVALIIVDDIIDQSDVRYNKPTWYKKTSQEEAILDSHYITTGAFMLLLKHLANHPSCLNIVNLIMEKTFITNVNQLMDIQKVGVKKFLKLISLRFDKAIYVFDGSIRSAMFLANINDKESHNAIKEFTIPMSRFFQIQNDFSGVFVKKDIFQRVCPDIILGRNSWVCATALKLATPAQRKVIEDNYGNGDVESVKKVIEVYQELKLDEVHKKKTEEFEKEMYHVVERLPKKIPKQPFRDLVQQMVLNKCYS